MWVGTVQGELGVHRSNSPGHVGGTSSVRGHVAGLPSARRSGGKGARAGRAHVARQLRDLESVFQGKNIGQDVPTK